MPDTNNPQEKIRWPPRIRPELIQRLYQLDAQGLQDEELIEKTGGKLYFRCQAILHVQNSELCCPRCGQLFVVQETNIAARTVCPGENCRWTISMPEYRQSWSKKRIWAGKALPAFTEFCQRYPKARSYKDKLLLIDRLIHSFHWDLKLNMPNRSVANNLIEGNHDQVITFLDQLSELDPLSKSAWRKTSTIMMKRRKDEA